MKNKLIILGIAATLLIVGCQQKVELIAEKPTLPATNYNYMSTGGVTVFSPTNNQLTNAGATLGRVLFYDKKLSLNNATACGSCHQQQNAFADGKQFSEGFEGMKTARNSMSLANLHNQSGYFWDLRANTLEEQVIMPIKNHIEMGLEQTDKLPAKLAKADYYPALFNAAFGSTEITQERIEKALSQFLRSMISCNSKFDIGAQTNYNNFNTLEKKGLQIYNESMCSSCHNNTAGANSGWWGSTVANIGLENVSADKGIMNISNNSFDDGRFKVPSLRNIALTGPYMHDGRFNTLEEVIDHYSTGIQATQNLNWELQDNTTGQPKKFNYSDDDKRALIAFFNTLTDFKYINDARFSDPFKAK